MGKRMRWGWLVLLSGLMPTTGCLQFHARDKGDPMVKDDANAKALAPPKILGSPQSKEEQARLYIEAAKQLESAEPEQAIQYYEKARDHDPRFAAHATKKLGVLYDVVGKFDKALVEYHLALQQNPRDADLWNDLGYGYYNRGNWKQAEESLRKATSINPKHPRAWTNLGMTLAQQGQFDESLSAFQKVIGKPQSYCNLGFILASQGRKHEARTAYLEALKLEPGLQVARTALAKMDEIDVNRVPSEPAANNKQASAGAKHVAGKIPPPRSFGSEEESSAEAIEAAQRSQPSAARNQPRPRSAFQQAIPQPLPGSSTLEEDETEEPELINPAIASAAAIPMRPGMPNNRR